MPCAAGVIFFFQRLKKKVTTGIDRQEVKNGKIKEGGFCK